MEHFSCSRDTAGTRVRHHRTDDTSRALARPSMIPVTSDSETSVMGIRRRRRAGFRTGLTQPVPRISLPRMSSIPAMGSWFGEHISPVCHSCSGPHRKFVVRRLPSARIRLARAAKCGSRGGNLGSLTICAAASLGARVSPSGSFHAYGRTVAVTASDPAASAGAPPTVGAQHGSGDHRGRHRVGEVKIGASVVLGRSSTTYEGARSDPVVTALNHVCSVPLVQ